MPVDTSIYNRPAGPNPLQNIMELGKAADTMGNFAVGGAVQGAMGTDGNIDQNALANILKQSPVGAMKAIPTMDALTKLREAGFSADQAGLETFQKRMAITHHLFSGLASKENPTMKDVYDIASTALDPALGAKKYGITIPVIMNAVKQFRGLNSKQIREKALEIQTQAASTSEILGQHSPGMQVVDQGNQLTIVPTGTKANPAMGTAIPKGLPPTTPVATPQGTRYLGQQPPVPGGGVVPGGGTAGSPEPAAGGGAGAGGAPVLQALEGAILPDQGTVAGRFPKEGEFAPGAPRQVPTQSFRRDGGVPATPVPTGPAASLEPGYEQAANVVANTSGAMASELTKAADGSQQRKAMLGNLEEDLGKFTSGQGADWTRVAKNFANRNLPVPDSWKQKGAILDQSSVAAQENFNKQATMIAQAQFGTIGGTGTDAKFESAFATSPNETLSQMGNKGIIRLLKGNEDAISAKNKAWQAWQKTGKGPNTYGEFSVDFNKNFDPRAFQFKYLEPKERQEYVNQMDPRDKAEFLNNLTYARKNGWVTFDLPTKK